MHSFGQEQKVNLELTTKLTPIVLNLYSVFDCRTHMAQVVYEDPIHHLSGKISKKYRTCYNYRKQSDRKYTSVHGERSTPVTEKEQTWRSQFAQIAAATRERMIDPAFLPGDQAAYAKQSKFKTFRAFVFNICKEEVLNGK